LDRAHAAAAFVDDRRAHGFGQVAGAFRLAAGVDQPDAAHVAVGNLIAHEIDRVVTTELFVNQLAGLAIRFAEFLLDRHITAVALRQLLLDDVGLNRHPEVVGLSGQIGGRCHVAFRSFEL
jgi:hypothetical protein